GREDNGQILGDATRHCHRHRDPFDCCLTTQMWNDTDDLRRRSRIGGEYFLHARGCRRNDGQAVSPALTNGVVVRQDIVDRAILVRSVSALDPAVLSTRVEKALASLAKRERAQIERRSLAERELSQIQQRVDRLVDALADGSLPHEELRTRLSAETSRK